MYFNHQQAFSRPRHLFDVPALSVLALAAVGESAIRLAHALDEARTAPRAHGREGLPRALEQHERELLPDFRRIR